MPSKLCRNGASCEKPNCRFQHPPPPYEIQVKKSVPYSWMVQGLNGFTESLPNLCNLNRKMSFTPPSYLFVGFLFQNLQAPNRLCKFGPDCQKPRCRFDHPPPPPLPLLEYEHGPHGFNIQPTDTDHVQEVRWPISCKMYDVAFEDFLFSV